MISYLQKLRLEVETRNAVNTALNQAADTLRPYFSELLGIKVINADGSISKKVRHGAEMAMLFLKPDDRITHWFEPSSYFIYFRCRKVYQWNETTHYVEGGVCVACIDGKKVGLFMKDPTPLRTDYDAEEVLAGRRKVSQLEKELEHCKRELWPFDSTLRYL